MERLQKNQKKKESKGSNEEEPKKEKTSAKSEPSIGRSQKPNESIAKSQKERLQERISRKSATNEKAKSSQIEQGELMLIVNLTHSFIFEVLANVFLLCDCF